MPILSEKFCNRCKEVKGSDLFYRRRQGKDVSPYCRVCTNNQTIERQRLFKKKCISYKGGCCEKCGYSKYDGALEFHHLDPNEKDFGISRARHTAFSDKTKLELDKCILLCANCHREQHAIDKNII